MYFKQEIGHLNLMLNCNQIRSKWSTFPCPRRQHITLYSKFSLFEFPKSLICGKTKTRLRFNLV